jgi:NitT/TauT family transport system ATP-binding protein
MTMGDAIRAEGLFFAWPGKAPLFEAFDLAIAAGEAWSVIGPSGSGKSTLLALFAGLEHPTSGTVSVHGEPLARPRPKSGLIIQDHGLLPWATVRQNVQLGQKIRRFYGPDGKHVPFETGAPLKTAAARKEEEATVQRWLERLGIASVAESYPARISGGQRQRTAIARTLVLGPDLLLMDEPFASLDEATREDLRRLTLDLKEEGGLSLVVVTHSIDEALALGGKILLLEAGTNRAARVYPNTDDSTPVRAALAAELRRGLRPS